jgi:hypothetical protein
MEGHVVHESAARDRRAAAALLTFLRRIRRIAALFLRAGFARVIGCHRSR